MKKFLLKIRLKYEGLLVSKNLKLRSEIRHYKKQIEELTKTNHKLIDEITIKNIEIRELNLNK